MELNLTPTSISRKEIRCSDCGGIYFTLSHTGSSCPHCGNVEFQPKGILREQDRAGDTLAEVFFRHQTDGLVVEDILMRYQVEWQLWVKVVENFSDPNFHSAYLTCVISQNAFPVGLKRYSDHRAVMLLQADLAWQAEIAEVMMERLKNVSLVRMEQEGVSRLPLHTWWALLPLQSRLFRYTWVFLGMSLAVRLVVALF